MSMPDIKDTAHALMGQRLTRKSSNLLYLILFLLNNMDTVEP